MVLARKADLVASFLERFYERNLPNSNLTNLAVIITLISRGILAGEKTGPAGTAKHRHRKSIFKPRSFLRQVINVRRLDHLVAVAA